MTRGKLAALLAAAGTGIVIGISATGYAADDAPGQGARLPAEQSQQQPSQSRGSQASGSTSGAATTGALQNNRGMQDSLRPYESTYVTPYEVQTPGPRDNIDD